MNCEDIALILDDGDIPALDGEVRRAVEHHLAGCPVCARVWSPLANLAKSPTPPVPPGFVDQCAALVVAESQPSGKRAAHTRLIVLGCLVAGAAAAGILTMHLSDRGTAGSRRSVAVAAPVTLVAPVTIPEPISSPPVTAKGAPDPGEVVPTTMPAVPAEPKPVGSEHGKSSADGCAGRPERVAALPGVAGFDLPKGGLGNQAEAALASETRDPIWASDMERHINEALQKKEGLRLSRAEAVCRMTACGVLLVYRPEADEVEYQQQVALAKELREALKDSLGFQGGGTSTMNNLRCEGTRFTLISLAGARGREQYLPPTTSHVAPALPRPYGVEIPVAGPPLADLSGNIENMLSELLAAEPVDRSSWSISMESALKSEASAVAGDRWSQILVECRVTTCGVVLAYPHSAGPYDSREISARLARALGFAGGGAIENRTIASGDFVTIYLRRGGAPRP